MTICICDGTTEGIMTAVFDAWTIGVDDTSIAIDGMNNCEWFAEYHNVTTDNTKALRVMSAIKKKISWRAYEMVYTASISDNPERGNAILGFLRKGFKIGASVVDDLQDDNVLKVFKLSKKTYREYEHYREFLRFRKQGAYLMAKVDPKSNILSMLADFFADRFRQESFMIVDMNRSIAAMHVPDSECIISHVDTEQIKGLDYDENEEEIRILWEVFEKTIAIEARINKKLQKQNMPLIYRKYMDIRK